MKKWTKSVLVTVLSAVFLLGCMGTAWAIDNASNFTTANTDGSSDTSSINLIKDYDSVHATEEAPYSHSPEETFTYTITPYGVWNAGSTYTGSGSSSGTGTAIEITTDNMPMLSSASGTSVTYTYTDSTTPRTLVIKQKVSKDAALKETTETSTKDAKATITLPDYSTVGDYWYQVVESKGEDNAHPTTGVFYGTNDNITGDNSLSNGGHNATYFIHVQVTKKNDSSTGTSTLVRNVTLHQDHPDTGWKNPNYNSNKDTLYAGNKVYAIENKYYAGQLQVQKIVAGSGGDISQYFKVRVTFTKPAGTVINSDIAIQDAFYDTATSGSTPTYAKDNNKIIPGQYANTSAPDAGSLFTWDKTANSTDAATAVAEFYVKHGTTVYFYNIPLGINYTVEEYTTGDLGYTNTFHMTRGSDELTPSFNGNTLTHDEHLASSHFYTDSGETINNVGAQGSITGANPDIVKITNSKDMTIDIGVITENAPYIAMLAVSGAALFLLVSRKKNPSEV